MSSNVAEMRREVQDLKDELRDVKQDLVEVRGLLTATLSLTRRMTGDENIGRAIGEIQRLIMVLNQARLAWHAYQVAQAGAGPLGWAMAAIGVVGATVTAAEMATDLGV